jgi:hypothetical protein
MSQDRLRQIRRGFADDASHDDGPPDLGPLRALAEREELADAAGRLADAYGRPLQDDDPLRPSAADVARALTEAGLTLHHCAQQHRLYRLGGVCLLPVAPSHDPDGRRGVVVSWTSGWIPSHFAILGGRSPASPGSIWAFLAARV